MEWHTEDCDDRNCHGSCHAGEIECECGEIWEGEWEDSPIACVACGEPYPDSAPTEKREDFHSDG